jgi:PAS domain S-box-containing protein
MRLREYPERHARLTFRGRAMTLRGKILAIILVTLAGLILILFGVSQQILLHSYVRLEEQDTSRNVQRALNALSDDVSRFETVVGDWAPWDDTYTFIDDLNAQYIESNLLDTTFNNLGLNLIMFLDSSGQVVFAKAFELEDQQELPVPQSLAEYLSPDSPIAYHSDIDSTTSGVLLLPDGPMLVASHPILTSEHDGPIKGTLIFGRFLDSVEVEGLAEMVSLSLVVQRLDEPPTTPDFEVASSALSEDTPIFVHPLNREYVAGYALVEDIYGSPVLMLRAEMPRDIYQQGQTNVLYFVLSLLGSGVVVTVVAMLLLEKSVLSPLSRLSRSVSHIGASGDLSARVTVAGRDELSSMGGEINRMLGALEKSHAALRESEEHYSALVGNLTDAVFKIKGRVIDWCNDKAEEIYGYRKDELVGMKPGVLFPVDVNPPEFIGGVSAAIKERGYFHGTAKVKRKDGGIIYIEYSISKIPGREPMELVSVARDVTERIQIENALRQSEERFRNVLDNSLDMIYSLNLWTGKYSYVSPSSEKLMGYSPEEFLALNPEELISLVHPDDAERLEQNIINLIKQGENSVLSTEYRIKHSDSDYCWVSDNRSVVYGEGNMPIAIVGSIRDITESRLAQEALRQREQDYLILLESTHDSIIVVDGETLKVVYGNKRSSLMFGFDPVLQDGVGVNLLDFIYPEDREKAIKGFEEDLYQQERRQRYDVRVKTNDGRAIWVSALATRIEFRGRVAVLLSLKDVTETRRAEEKLNQTMAELTRSNTELEQFAYVASHDLQEPLRMVASYTQLLARRYKGKLDEDADEFIGYAVDGATRMQQLINDLLAYSRVGTRGKPFESTDCEEILNKALINLHVAIGENNAVVTHDQLPTVMADPVQLTQLFQNLIGNAIKFHGDNRPEVHVGAQRNCSDWFFSVRDNGIGIDPNDHERIFLIFQRLHGRKEYPGTGIGLTICRKIVDRHKGRIWVESQSGQGATFHFTIPDGEGGKS